MSEEHDAISALDARVDGLDRRLTVVETALGTMRAEVNKGLEEVKQQLQNILDERRAWSAWARENLPKVGKWVGKWSIILVGVAIGINNLPGLVQAIKAWGAGN